MATKRQALDSVGTAIADQLAAIYELEGIALPNVQASSRLSQLCYEMRQELDGMHDRYDQLLSEIRAET